MKLYTEEQVKKAYNQGRTDWINEIENDNILSKLTPIELPSDEEIKEHIHTAYSFGLSELVFMEGAKWMKEQILNQNKQLWMLIKY